MHTCKIYGQENAKIDTKTPCNFKNSLKLNVKILLFFTSHQQIP
jgi:hypothetical protein